MLESFDVFIWDSSRVVYAICKVRDSQGGYTNGCCQDDANDVDTFIEVEFA
jgi:hypothetical protein